MQPHTSERKTEKTDPWQLMPFIVLQSRGDVYTLVLSRPLWSSPYPLEACTHTSQSECVCLSSICVLLEAQDLPTVVSVSSQQSKLSRRLSGYSFCLMHTQPKDRATGTIQSIIWMFSLCYASLIMLMLFKLYLIFKNSGTTTHLRVIDRLEMVSIYLRQNTRGSEVTHKKIKRELHFDATTGTCSLMPSSPPPPPPPHTHLQIH